MLSTTFSCRVSAPKPYCSGLCPSNRHGPSHQRERVLQLRVAAKVFAAGKRIFNKCCNKETLKPANASVLNCLSFKTSTGQIVDLNFACFYGCRCTGIYCSKINIMSRTVSVHLNAESGRKRSLIVQFSSCSGNEFVCL